MGSTSDTNSFAKHYGGYESEKSTKKSWRNIFIFTGVTLLSAGIILAIVIPVCISNDCSGMLVEPTTKTPQPATSTTTGLKTTTTRTTITTTTRAPVTTTTVTTTPAPPPTTTTSTPRTRPTLTPPTTPTTSTEPPVFVPRDLTAATASGPIVGHEIVLDFDGQLNSEHSRIASWIGIPFAKPPVGPLRWQKPQPPDPWTEPLIADTHKGLCVQSGGTVRATHPNWPDSMFVEDCLYLHVFGPMHDSAEPYPVMVWIYGGSFQSGGNVQYPGHFLASKGVVVVTLNYRLNIFGFASTEDGTTPGNFGLWDQREAILWVENNIAAFGGDPNKITVFGESAGAASTGLVVASPQVKGHIHAAIMESGSDYAIWAVNAPEVQPELFINDVAPQFSCQKGQGGITTDTEMMDCLRNVDDVQLLRRANFYCPFCLGFAPVVDGPGGFLPKMPVELRNDRSSSEIPVIIGTNDNECSIGLIAEDETLILRGVNRTEYEWAMREVFDYFEYFITETPTDAVKEELYEAMSWFYAPWPTIDDGQLNKEYLSQACVDIAFASTANDLLRHHSRYSPTYRYVFGFMPRVSGWRLIPEWIGVPHAVELGAVWGFPFLGANPAVAADSGNISLDVGIPLVFSDLDKAFSDYTMTLWTNFAKYHNPTPTPISPPGGDGPELWEPFTEDSQKYLDMDNEGTKTKTNYRSFESSFVNNYMNGLGRGADNHNPKGMPDWPLPTESTLAAAHGIIDNEFEPILRHTQEQFPKLAKVMKDVKRSGIMRGALEEFDFDALRRVVRSYVERVDPELLKQN